MDIKIYQRERQKLNLIRRAKITFFCLSLAIFSIWGFFWLPIFRITIINTDDYVIKSEVESAINPYLASVNNFWLPNNNYFLIKNNALETALKEKGVGLATVKISFPRTININFPQNEPWLIYCSDIECFYVSDKGFLIDRAPKFSESPLPQIITEEKNAKIGDMVASLEQIKILRNIFQNLNNMKISVISVFFAEKNEIKINVSENWYLRLLNNANLQKSLDDLKLLLIQKIKDDRPRLEYIDMRFPDKAFYKLREN